MLIRFEFEFSLYRRDVVSMLIRFEFEFSLYRFCS